MSSGTSSRHPAKNTLARRAAQLLLRERVPLVEVSVSHDHEAGSWEPPSDRIGGREELPVSLLGDEAPDGSDHKLIVGDAQIAPGFRDPFLSRERGFESGQVEAVAEVRPPTGPDDSEAPSPRQVLRRLVQLEVAEPSRDPLSGQDRSLPAEPVVGCRVQAMHRVHDAGNPDDSRRDPTHDAGLRVVCVDEVVAASSKDADQLAERARVGARIPCPRRARPRYVPDPLGLQVGDPGPRSGYRGDLEAGVV